jgi:hypothetical protein
MGNKSNCSKVTNAKMIKLESNWTLRSVARMSISSAGWQIFDASSEPSHSVLPSRGGRLTQPAPILRDLNSGLCLARSRRSPGDPSRRGFLPQLRFLRPLQRLPTSKEANWTVPIPCAAWLANVPVEPSVALVRGSSFRRGTERPSIVFKGSEFPTSDANSSDLSGIAKGRIKKGRSGRPERPCHVGSQDANPSTVAG